MRGGRVWRSRRRATKPDGRAWPRLSGSRWCRLPASIRREDRWSPARIFTCRPGPAQRSRLPRQDAHLIGAGALTTDQAPAVVLGSLASWTTGSAEPIRYLHVFAPRGERAVSDLGLDSRVPGVAFASPPAKQSAQMDEPRNYGWDRSHFCFRSWGSRSGSERSPDRPQGFVCCAQRVAVDPAARVPARRFPSGRTARVAQPVRCLSVP